MWQKAERHFLSEELKDCFVLVKEIEIPISFSNYNYTVFIAGES